MQVWLHWLCFVNWFFVKIITFISDKQVCQENNFFLLLFFLKFNFIVSRIPHASSVINSTPCRTYPTTVHFSNAVNSPVFIDNQPSVTFNDDLPAYSSELFERPNTSQLDDVNKKTVQISFIEELPNYESQMAKNAKNSVSNEQIWKCWRQSLYKLVSYFFIFFFKNKLFILIKFLKIW